MTDTDKLAALLVEYAGGSEGRLDAHHFPLLARWLTERGVIHVDDIKPFCKPIEPSETAMRAAREEWDCALLEDVNDDERIGMALRAAYRAQFGDP
jgi:hypothetical protein